MWFTSDNAGPAAPEIMAAMMKANEIYSQSYGADPIMDRVRDRIRDIFEAPDAAVYLVTTGTAANSLALASMVQPWETIY
ncbi:MAG: beta-eliminating lyase-related protein, partial [Alphaproteobacteria bacterium]